MKDTKMMNNNNAMMVFIGTILTIIGVFLPLASFMGSDVSYYDVGGTEKYVFLIAVIAAPVMLFLNKQKFIMASAAVAWFSLLYPVIRGWFKVENDGFLSKVSSKVGGALSDMTGSILTNVGDYSWGGFVFLIGLLVLTVGCVKVWRS